jgi:hypothetical protein
VLSHASPLLFYHWYFIFLSTKIFVEYYKKIY